MGRDPFHQPRVLQAPSNLALSTAREGASTTSLGNLGQGLTTLIVKNFFLIFISFLSSFILLAVPVRVVALVPMGPPTVPGMQLFLAEGGQERS